MMLREAFYLIKHGIDSGFGSGSFTRCRVFVTVVAIGSTATSRSLLLLVIRMTSSGGQIVNHDSFDAILDVAACTTRDRWGRRTCWSSNLKMMRLRRMMSSVIRGRNPSRLLEKLRWMLRQLFTVVHIISKPAKYSKIKAKVRTILTCQI